MPGPECCPHCTRVRTQSSCAVMFSPARNAWWSTKSSLCPPSSQAQNTPCLQEPLCEHRGMGRIRKDAGARRAPRSLVALAPTSPECCWGLRVGVPDVSGAGKRAGLPGALLPLQMAMALGVVPQPWGAACPSCQAQHTAPSTPLLLAPQLIPWDLGFVFFRLYCFSV